MFDPTISVYASIFLYNFTKGINDGDPVCGPLFLSVNSENMVQLNWDFTTCTNRPDVIKLHTISKRSSLVRKSIREVAVRTNNKIRGNHVTQHQFSQKLYQFPYGWGKNDVDVPRNGAHCLPFIIESSLNNEVIDRRCLRIYPTWMQNYGELQIGELVIPGTHNSGAYTGPFKHFGGFIYNQKMDLYEQLVFGQRYFDIRVGISPTDKKIYITHNIFPTSFFGQVLDDIVAFVEKAPKEIIIVDIHQFNTPLEFTHEEHEEVLGMIQAKIGKYLVLRDLAEGRKGPTLEAIWRVNKSIILAYADYTVVTKYRFLWPPVRRYWGNKIEKMELLEYFLSMTKGPDKGNPMQVLMAELTPTAWFITMNPRSSLGKLADIINDDLVFWFRHHHITKNINIVATDFFLGNNFIEYALEENNKIMYGINRDE